MYRNTPHYAEKTKKACSNINPCFDMTVEFGIIGGSGFYSISSKGIEEKIETPYGNVLVNIFNINNKKVAFITRHGPKHSIPPHLVNYRANIFALHSIGVKQIITSSAVGSMKKEMALGSFVIPDQFIDFTIGRPKTFFVDNFEVKLHNGTIRKGVVHIDLSEPYCPHLRNESIVQSKKIAKNTFSKGVYVCTEGPRFETPAEINAFKILGGSLVGMTSVSESILARELGICYSTICLVTNFAAGMQEKISAEEVFAVFKSKVHELEKIIVNTIANLDISAKDCSCDKL